MTFSATASSSRVAAPGRTAASTASMVPATIRPARRIFSISWGDFRMIMTPWPGRGSRQVRQDRHGTLRDPLLVPVGVHLAEQALLPVVLHQGLGVAVVHLQPVPHRGLVVIVAMGELPAAEVAHVLHRRRVELHVVGPLAPA